MLIEDLITRAPVTVSRGSHISLAARRMAESDVGSVVVVDGREPIGIITDRDIALHMAAGVEDARVEEMMTAHPVAVERGTDVEQCIEKMGSHEVRRILVLDEDDELEGVVSLDDIVIHLSNTLEKAAGLIRAEMARV
ncbi:MAG TPA: CBS domain-containing protein [Gemmatimonadota bacterium]|jgi:CBS domain-containing protein